MSLPSRNAVKKGKNELESDTQSRFLKMPNKILKNNFNGRSYLRPPPSIRNPLSSISTNFLKSVHNYFRHISMLLSFEYAGKKIIS